MEKQDFIDLLTREFMAHHINEQGQIIINHPSDVGLNILFLPENVVFKNRGDVWLPDLVWLPENTIFQNDGYVHLYKVRNLPETVHFENNGNLHLDSLETIPDGFAFGETLDSVVLTRLHKLGENVRFLNSSMVMLHDLKRLPASFSFENKGDVWLNSLEGLPKLPKKQLLYRFNNKGYVYFENMRTLPIEQESKVPPTSRCHPIRNWSTFGTDGCFLLSTRVRKIKD